MKVRRFISVLIGLLLIGLWSYKLIDYDLHNIPNYFGGISGLPEFLTSDIVNMVIFYFFFTFKVLAVLLIAFGCKRCLLIGTLLLPIVIGEFYVMSEPLNVLLWLIETVGFQTVLENLNLGDMLQIGALLLVLVYWIVLFVIVVAKKTKSLSSKIVLLVFALLPVVSYYVDVLIIKDMQLYSPNKLELIVLSWTLLLPVFITLMLMLSQQGKKKPPCKNVWFPAIETL